MGKRFSSLEKYQRDDIAAIKFQHVLRALVKTRRADIDAAEPAHVGARGFDARGGESSGLAI
jgi:hypothetical protein